jgi:hypothetical protein
MREAAAVQLFQPPDRERRFRTVAQQPGVGNRGAPVDGVGDPGGAASRFDADLDDADSMRGRLWPPLRDRAADISTACPCGTNPFGRLFSIGCSARNRTNALGDKGSPRTLAEAAVANTPVAVGRPIAAN